MTIAQLALTKFLGATMNYTVFLGCVNTPACAMMVISSDILFVIINSGFLYFRVIQLYDSSRLAPYWFGSSQKAYPCNQNLRLSFIYFLNMNLN